MGDDLATNVNRSYSLAATSITIFLSFLYPLLDRTIAVASLWFALWLVYILLVIRDFPRIQTARGKGLRTAS